MWWKLRCAWGRWMDGVKRKLGPWMPGYDDACMKLITHPSAWNRSDLGLARTGLAAPSTSVPAAAVAPIHSAGADDGRDGGGCCSGGGVLRWRAGRRTGRWACVCRKARRQRRKACGLARWIGTALRWTCDAHTPAVEPWAEAGRRRPSRRARAAAWPLPQSTPVPAAAVASVVMVVLRLLPCL